MSHRVREQLKSGCQLALMLALLLLLVELNAATAVFAATRKAAAQKQRPRAGALTAASKRASEIDALRDGLSKREGSTEMGDAAASFIVYSDASGVRLIEERLSQGDYGSSFNRYYSENGALLYYHEQRDSTRTGADAPPGKDRIELRAVFNPQGQLTASRKTINGKLARIEETETSRIRARAALLQETRAGSAVAQGAGGSPAAPRLQTEGKVESYEEIYPGKFNMLTSTGAARGDARTKDLLAVAMRFVGKTVEARTTIIEMAKRSAEDAGSATVVVTIENLLDDSVRAEKYKLEMLRADEGWWRVERAYKARTCWPGRGHTNYSSATCR